MIPRLGKSPGGENSYPFQYSGLENSMDCRVHGVAKSWTQLSDFHSLTHGKIVYVLIAQSCLILATPSTAARLLCSWNFPGKNTRIGCHFLLQEIFATQGSNHHPLCLLLWKPNPWLLSHQGSPYCKIMFFQKQR